MNNPLIITLLIDPDAEKYFTSLRNIHFPAHINFLQAHLTLFHALPQHEGLVQDTLAELSGRKQMSLQVTGLRNIGNGVAYQVLSPELLQLHKEMQRRFKHFLAGKDKEPLWPHITIQNKVTAFKAKSLFEKLSGDFIPMTITATGFGEYVYEGGPWKHVRDYAFSSEAES